MTLLFLAIPASFTMHAQPPSQAVEQTVRHVYQNCRSNVTALYSGETGERAIAPARVQQTLTLNNNLTLPGDIDWSDYDPVCDYRGFGDLMSESVVITQTDAGHADAIMRFHVSQDDKEKTSQTLKIVVENGRWVIDDIISNHGSVLQVVSSESEKTLAAIALLRKEQPETFVVELSKHITDCSWPWTWVISDSYHQMANALYKTTFRTTSSLDEDISIERQFIYDNPICFGEELLLSHVDEIRVLEKAVDSARIHVHFALTNGSNEGRELILQ